MNLSLLKLKYIIGKECNIREGIIYASQKKKKSEKFLPLLDVEIGAWPEQNFLLGLLLNQETGWDWVMNQFIQLRGSHYLRYQWEDVDTSITFYPYAIHQLTPNLFDLCPYINKYAIPKSMILENYREFHEFVKCAINGGYYLSTFLDQFFREDLSGNHGFHHPTFLYGYDDGVRSVYLADNFEKGKYGRKKITYTQLDRAFAMVPGDVWEVSVFLYKLVPYKHHFTVKYVKEQIKDYLEPGKGICYFNRTVCPEPFYCDEEYKNEVYFGINCYCLLLRYLDAILKDDKEYLLNDWRSFVMLCDHKHLMIKRYEYMTEKGYMKKNVLLYEQLIQLEKDCRIIQNMFIKYTITGEKEIIVRLIKRIKNLRQKDIKCMKLFIDIIY